MYNLMLSIASNLVLSSINSTTIAAVSKVESSTNPKLQLLMSTAIAQDSEGVGSAQTHDNEEWTPIEKAIEDVLQVRVYAQGFLLSTGEHLVLILLEFLYIFVRSFLKGVQVLFPDCLSFLENQSFVQILKGKCYFFAPFVLLFIFSSNLKIPKK